MSRVFITSNINRSLWVSVSMKQRNLLYSKLARQTINISQNRYYVQKSQKGETDKTADQNQSPDAKDNPQPDTSQVEAASNNCQIRQMLSNWMQAAVKRVRTPKSPGPNTGSDPKND